jgi:tetratricopeptide (TPR) repeat protein
MGKTTIAVNALHDKRVAARFGERLWFVRCDGVKSRAELIAAIATAVGLPITPTVEQSVMASLAGSSAVLVIDNAETPLDADESEVEKLLALMGTIQSLAMIVTIRGHKRPRGVPWQTSLEAERLDEQAARDVFLAVSGKDKFADDAFLYRLLGALDGVALAITLMARYAEVFDSLEPVWSVWDRKRTAMLKDGEESTRETNIVASYELSISTLTTAGRRLLAGLAMLPNGVALIDLDNVFPDSEEPARELRARALIFDESQRLRILAPLREYVAAAYLPDSRDAQAATDHYIALALREGNKVGHSEGSSAVARLAPELANIEFLLANTSSQTPPLFLARAAVAWANLIRFTGLGSMSVIEGMARRSLEYGMTKEAAACLATLGDIARTRFDHEAAQSWYLEAVPLFRTVGDVRGEALCVWSIGEVAFRRQDHDTAQKQFEEALVILRRIGDVLGEALCIFSLGDLAAARSERETTKKRLEEALPLFLKVGDIVGEANCIFGFGQIANARKDHLAARKEFEKALSLYQGVGAVLGEANCFLILGAIALAMGNRDEAEERTLKALALYEKLPDPYSIGLARERLAGLASGEVARRAHLSAARAAWHSIGRDDLVDRLDADFGDGVS